MPLINVGAEPNDGTGDSRRLAGQKLNAFVPLIVKSTSLTSPPGSPSINDRYIIPTGATGDWSNKAGAIACYQQSFWDGTSWDNNGGWMIFSAETGMTATLETDDSVIRFDGIEWKEILPSGGFPTEVLNVGQSLQDLEESLGDLAILDTVGTAQIENDAITSDKLGHDAVKNEHMFASAEQIPTSNWDDVVTNGLWMGHTTVNNPLGSDAKWWIGQTIAHNNLYVTQKLWDFTEINPTIYRRYRTNGSWLPWTIVSGGTILAWTVFDATGTLTLIDGYNVSGITDNAVGDYTIHFTNALPKTTYGMMGSVASNYQNSSAMPIIKASSSQWGTPVAKTTTQCQILINHYASANADRSEVYVAFIG